MFCIYCGTALPDHAKFCFQCGKPIEYLKSDPVKAAEKENDLQPESCEIIYVPVQEKVGLFPKEKGRFDAVTLNGGKQEIVASSPVFDLGGLNLYGPQEKNARHKKPLEELVACLAAEGWLKQKKKGPMWFSLQFTRTKK